MVTVEGRGLGRPAGSSLSVSPEPHGSAPRTGLFPLLLTSPLHDAFLLPSRSATLLSPRKSSELPPGTTSLEPFPTLEFLPRCSFLSNTQNHPVVTKPTWPRRFCSRLPSLCTPGSYSPVK